MWKEIHGLGGAQEVHAKLCGKRQLQALAFLCLR